MQPRGHLQGSVASRIVERLEASGRGSIFIVRDFLDLGSRRAVDESLRRLTAEGTLRRLGQGLYDYPRISTLLGVPVPPPAEKLAAALARRTGASVLPGVAQAANTLGVSTQVPAKSVFRTNGTKPKRITAGKQVIELRPTAPGQFRNDDLGMVIAALRFLGEQNVGEEVLQRLRSQVTPELKEALAREWQTAPGWMHPLLQALAK